jgi:hypothetical protein
MTFGRALGLGFLGLEAYRGYQEGGMMGAVGQVAETAAINYAIGAVIGTGALTALAATGLVAGAAYGTYAYNKYGSEIGRSYMLRHTQTEFGGGGVPDQFGTAATMRRRSMAALQGSRINGNMALGNEAALTYTPYFR